MAWPTLLVISSLIYSCTAGTSPNIIFIVADDLGWNDLGYNNPDMITPNIDSLANNGIILDQSYVQPLCSPSRAAFMTGIYPFRYGLQHQVINMQQDVCAPDKTFLPQVLKTKGYATHMIGKWHLGFCRWACTPTYRGFDTFYGFYSGGEDYYTKIFPNGYDFRNNTKVERSAAGNYSTFQFGDRAEEIIRTHDKTNPFFIYLPFSAPHMPLQAPDEYIAMYPNVTLKNRKIYSGMVTAMDKAIGQVVATLKDTDLYNNTIIMFVSDNGGWTVFGGNNYPLRGGKISLFEGGTRVPAFIHSPMLNQTGVRHNGMMHAVDWFPTIAEAAGVAYTNPDQDGVSQWSSITSLGKSPRNEFIYNLDLDPVPIQGQSAIRVGDYKLIKGYPGAYPSWYKPEDDDQGVGVQLNFIVNNVNVSPAVLQNQLNITIDPGYHALYNLKDDPEERNNLYDQLPDVVKDLQAKLDKEKQRYVAPKFPPNVELSLPTNYGGAWSPGWC